MLRPPSIPQWGVLKHNPVQPSGGPTLACPQLPRPGGRTFVAVPIRREMFGAVIGLLLTGWSLTEFKKKAGSAVPTHSTGKLPKNWPDFDKKYRSKLGEKVIPFKQFGGSPAILWHSMKTGYSRWVPKTPHHPVQVIPLTATPSLNEAVRHPKIRHPHRENQKCLQIVKMSTNKMY